MTTDQELRNYPQSRGGRSGKEGLQSWKLLDFWDSAEDGHLRKSVTASGGEIDLLVHPFVPTNTDWTERDQVESQREKDRIHKEGVIDSIRASTKPVLIMEEGERIQPTEVLLMSRGIDRPVYVVLTRDDNPEPLIKGKRSGRGWDIFKDKLKSLGVSRINLGGKFYWINNQGKGQGCVSKVKDKLDGSFTTSINGSLSYNP